MRAQIQEILERNPGGWVIDGDYESATGPMVRDAATDIICSFSSPDLLCTIDCVKGLTHRSGCISPELSGVR
jgi:hypothetical protein